MGGWTIHITNSSLQRQKERLKDGIGGIQNTLLLAYEFLRFLLMKILSQRLFPAVGHGISFENSNQFKVAFQVRDALMGRNSI